MESMIWMFPIRRRISYSSSIASKLLRTINIINIIIIILLIWEFFTPALAESFPPESDWEQLSSNLQDYS